MAEQSAIQVPRMEEWPSEPLPLPGQLRGGGGVCSLWEDPVGCPLSQGPGDDGSSPYIPLPFTFNLYGQLYNGLWMQQQWQCDVRSALRHVHGHALSGTTSS